MNTVHWNAFLVWMLAAGSAAAADSSPTKFSITPFAGYRVGGTFTDETSGNEREIGEARNYGVVLDFYASPETELEVLWSRQRSELEGDAATASPAVDLRIDYLHIGGTYLFQAQGVQPFFVATIGATHFDPSADGSDSDTRFSFGVGGGVKIPIVRHFGLRFEARAYGTVLSNDSEVMCVNGRCLVNADGTLLWQYEANAGVYLAF